MPRAHYQGPVQDAAGNLTENTVIRVLQPGTTNLIADPIYATDDAVEAMSNPFTTTSGYVSFYLDIPQRVRIGYAPPSLAERFKEDVDVGSISGGGGGTDNHVGTGTGSTVVGLSATSGGTNSTALGQNATSSGENSTSLGSTSVTAGLNATAIGFSASAAGERGTALGRSSNASVLGSTALGYAASATGQRGSAVGDTAVANSTRSSALGANASGGHDHATAVGSESSTTEANQVMLGTSSDTVEIPGGAVMTASNGRRFRLRVLPDGALTTTSHIPSGTTNLLPVDEQGFEAGIGAWATVSGLTSAAQSTDYAFAGTRSLKLTLSGSAAASARSSKVSAAVGSVYVGQTRMYYATGAMTGGLNGTCWLEFYDGSNVLIGSASAGASRMFYADTWTVFDVRAKAPALTATVAMRIGLPTGGGTNGNVFYADSCGIFLIPGTV